jgi:hypothetical protein
MFRAVKKPLEVEVTFDGQKVHVKPLKIKQGESIVYRTLARCEEFLAQMFLQEQSSSVGHRGLVGFFQQRGWAITEKAF